jgi:uncharacterized membrane protein YeaQ/YmgE (transglycosylase-associated protein family)
MFLALSIAVAIGSIAGWLVGELVRETGFGFLGDILIGIGGACIVALTFPMLHLDFGHGLVSWAVATAIGAVTLLLVACLLKRLLSFAGSRGV